VNFKAYDIRHVVAFQNRYRLVCVVTTPDLDVAGFGGGDKYVQAHVKVKAGAWLKNGVFIKHFAKSKELKQNNYAFQVKNIFFSLELRI
jgi:hypothetical protein